MTDTSCSSAKNSANLARGSGRRRTLERYFLILVADVLLPMSVLTGILLLLSRADELLYRAKMDGKNRGGPATPD